MSTVDLEKQRLKSFELDLGPAWQLEEIELFLQRLLI